MNRKRGLLIFWESISTVSWFDVGGWFASRGISEKEVGRRYLATAIIALLTVGACLVSWWAFEQLNAVIATVICIASWAIAFIVALWVVGRMLPPKIHSER